MEDFYFDPDADIEISHGHFLPHWHQPGKLQYVTFRLADALPQTMLNDLQLKKDTFHKINPKPWSKEVINLYNKNFGRFEHALLDRGYGSCVLRDAKVRQIFIDALHHFDGIRYQIIAYVIMPNHVHAVFAMLDNNNINEALQSVKTFTTKEINKLLNRHGHLWCNDQWDRIIRNEDHLKHCINYISNNPRYLPPTHYTLYLP